MKIEGQLAHLNKLRWIVMTQPDANTTILGINIATILDDLNKDGYLVCVGDKEHCYSIGELRAIDRLVAWITQIIYAKKETEDYIGVYEECAETDKFDDMIDEA
jgi:hypothetical protein